MDFWTLFDRMEKQIGESKRHTDPWFLPYLEFLEQLNICITDSGLLAVYRELLADECFCKERDGLKAFSVMKDILNLTPEDTINAIGNGAKVDNLNFDMVQSLFTKYCPDAAPTPHQLFLLSLGVFFDDRIQGFIRFMKKQFPMPNMVISIIHYV